MEVIKFDEVKKTWHQIARHHDANIPPSFELEVYKKMLDIFHVGKFYYYIVNLANVEIEFVSDKITEVLGIRPSQFSVAYLYENLHPDDQVRFAAFEQKVTAFFNNLPPEKVLKYKVSYDYKVRCTDGSYKWILMQTVTLQSNDEGAVLRVLGVQTDITHLKTDNQPSGLSFLGLDGEPSYHNVKLSETQMLNTNDIFSKREKEVLRLILAGKNSAEIADLLYISSHTVNTHRKNIMSKSNCNNLAELGATAIKEAWL